MLRTNAAGLYGPEIIFMGTCWPGPQIGKRLGHVIKQASDDGHEIGLHAWDHHQWQAKCEKMTPQEIFNSLKKGVDMLTEITGKPPTCSAVPGWKCTNELLLEKMKFPFEYNSDCRGLNIFIPEVEGQKLSQIQVPVTMPTYDEVLGTNGVTDENYNDYMLSLLEPDQLNVLTIHAEAEGGKCSGMFEEFVKAAQAKGYQFVPLGELVKAQEVTLCSRILPKDFPGREGWLACEESFDPDAPAI
jgi:undecaprenyl phosphate-alpha-L-ara4FN deformylase